MPRSKKFNYSIATVFCIGILCFAVKWLTEMLDATKSSVKANGVLEEPYFFLIPVGWLFLIIGVILFAVKVILSLVQRIS